MASGAFREHQEAGIICNNHQKQALHGCLGNRASFLGYLPSYEHFVESNFSKSSFSKSSAHEKRNHQEDHQSYHHGTYRHRLCRLCAELQGIGMNPSSVFSNQYSVIINKNCL